MPQGENITGDFPPVTGYGLGGAQASTPALKPWPRSRKATRMTDTANPDCPAHGQTADQLTTEAPPRQRDVILQTAASLISGDRQEVYGSAIDDFTRTGRMWAAILGLDEVTPEQVALCMAALKIGRLCQTPTHQDSWIDACGYLALGGDIADEHNRDTQR